mmetsp:Transcript_30021/g.63200  ORF Transcript_30021/g.63200 Transcript_30021/m.63200 type:complete len:106 (-) Transcript_30021:24-341(-)
MKRGFYRVFRLMPETIRFGMGFYRVVRLMQETNRIGMGGEDIIISPDCLPTTFHTVATYEAQFIWQESRREDTSRIDEEDYKNECASLGLRQSHLANVQYHKKMW